MTSTIQLFARYYSRDNGFVDGTTEFHGIIRRYCPAPAAILEIGAGPGNPTSDFLSTLGALDGVDVSADVLQNRALRAGHVFDGRKFPFRDRTYDLCVSNYVLEHVQDVSVHFGEIVRVLKPHGAYVFRTPNLWHYVTAVSHLLPDSLHQVFSPKLRTIKVETCPTFYRANRARKLRALCRNANLAPLLRMVEKEPSYGRLSTIAFYPMMIYERVVNRFSYLSGFRANIFGVAIRSARSESEIGNDSSADPVPWAS